MEIVLKASDKDNVATVFANDVKAGKMLELLDKTGNTGTLMARDDIPYGHKIAVKPIRQGEMIMKYGEEIGIAVRAIEQGEHVHVHNLDSMRGRGDQ
jgi:altronate dehydratase small subunit